MLSNIKILLPLIKNKLASDSEIKKLLNSGRSKPLNDISDQIVFDRTLDTSELNELTGAQTFITLSINTIVNQGTSLGVAFRVGIAANSSLQPIDGVSVQLELLNRVIYLIESSKFGFPNRPEFERSDEFAFDNDRNILGQMAMFTVEDVKN